MLVTITTDASYYHQQKAGGYAFWITSNKGRLRYANAFNSTIHSANDAEFKCIINALHFLKRYNWPITQLVINTDSKAIINCIEGTAKPKTVPEHATININHYKAIIKAFNMPPVSLRHVKGHSHTNTARNWVNDWCDKNAKAAAKKKIFGS